MAIMTGTPLQKRLAELYNVLEPIGGRDLLGSEAAFRRRYVRTEAVATFVRGGRERTVSREVGYQNIEEFKQKIAPLALRRTAADIEDVTLPSVIPHNIDLDLHPRQRLKYEELRSGVITIVRERGVEIKHAEAMAKVHYGAQICGGLATLGEADGPGASVKLDWVLDTLGEGGDLDGEKAVIFCAYKATVRALQNRLARAGIGYVTVWGEERD